LRGAWNGLKSEGHSNREIARGHAPTFLIQEIESKIPILAQQHRIAEHFGAKEKAALGLADAKALLSSLGTTEPEARSSLAVAS
jgi:hypothetical protein